LIPFGSMENGFKQITSVDRPIHKVDDLHGFDDAVNPSRTLTSLTLAGKLHPRST
jgi:TRAP-type C4-dicarboxylate transport system substrate-binding protein